MTDLLDLIAETLNVEAAELRADSSQENIAAWTSLKHLELMLALEREFGVTLTTEQMLELTSVPKIAARLKQTGCWDE